MVGEVNVADAGRKLPKKAILIVVVAVVLILAAAIPMAQTSSTEFCLSCHEMKRYQDELKKSSHAVDKDKKAIGCQQCHIPNSIGLQYLTVKVFLGFKDMWVHQFGDPQRLDRRRMQVRARRFIVDENCLACHQDLLKDAKGEKKISPIGELCHQAYLESNGNTKRGCAGCHFNMAHLPQFDRRLFFNLEFAARLPLIPTERR